MTYRDSFNTLRTQFDLPAMTIHLKENDIEIHRCTFRSANSLMLPGAAKYRCEEHGKEFCEDLESRIHGRVQSYPNALKHGDIDILENKEFTYSLFKKAEPARSKKVILLFHGLNEHSWHKYLPWAKILVERTGKTVVLFPIAFHMNRIPAEWGQSRPMNAVSCIRRGQSPVIVNSSFANAAISARIEMIPQRFFWSGLQTFEDVVDLIDGIKKGEHPLIDPDASIDVFAYSIGSFLSEILMMANPHEYFSESKLFIFCGGPTLDRMSPNSKFILDSDATIALYSFYTERLEAELRLDRRIAHYFSGAHPVGGAFSMLLSYQKNKEMREQRFRELQNQLRAVALKKDDVIPANEVLNTLKGDYRDIGVTVDVMDFPYLYTHINPFPDEVALEKLVDDSFNEVFERVAEHLA